MLVLVLLFKRRENREKFGGVIEFMYGKPRRKRLRQLSILKFIGASWGVIENKLCDDPELTSHPGTVSLKTVRNDWSNRDEWLDDIWDFEDPEVLAKTVIAEKQRLKHKAWEMLRGQQERLEESKGNPDINPPYNEMLGTLRFINDIGSDEVTLLQSLGEVEKEPERFEVALENAKEKLNDRLSEGTSAE